MLLDRFAGRRVLITGHAGFKGAWLTLLLHSLGAKVYGYSLLPNSKPRLYDVIGVAQLLQDECIADIRDIRQLRAFMQRSAPELVLHLAAQPLVSIGYADPVTTFETNVIGTLNVLEACRTCDSVKAVVNVTTDKCYENHEDGRPFKESDPLGGYDPYSASKACSEIVSSSYRRSFLQQNVTLRLATARAGNVISGGDWAENRLLPDCIRSLAQHKSITIRQPQSIRPWQLVLEPLIGYLCLATYLLEGKANIAPSYNFGPQPQEGLTVKQIAELAIEAWGSGEINIAHSPTFQEAKLLTLDISKATAELGVSPVLNAAQAVSWSVQWYRHFYQGPSTDMRTFSLQQIADFIARARTLGLSWAQD